MDNHKTYMCSAKLTREVNKPEISVRTWEKKLQQETAEKSVDVIMQKVQQQEELYFESLQHYGKNVPYK